MDSFKRGVSITICTYNGKRNLDKTLDYLAIQKNIDSIPVELIVVDNASTDGTSEFVRTKWLSLQSPIPLVLLQEPRVGKANATKTAFKAAKYNYIVICDDDNWLCDTYVRQVYDLLSAHADIGVLGGRGEPVFEDKKPEWFNAHQTLFATGKQYDESGDVTGKIQSLWGAGMVVRKEAWEKLEHLDYQFLLNEKRDRKGNWGGDDTELCMMIENLGYRMWVENNMVFQHYMPAARMTASYVRSRFYGLGRSRLYFRAYIYCRTHHEMPGKNLRYPLWLDKWVHGMKQYFSLLPEYIFKPGTGMDLKELKYIALKGELYELWRLKNRYNDIFAYIFDVMQKIKALKQTDAGQ